MAVVLPAVNAILCFGFSCLTDQLEGQRPLRSLTFPLYVFANVLRVSIFVYVNFILRKTLLITVLHAGLPYSAGT